MVKFINIFLLWLLVVSYVWENLSYFKVIYFSRKTFKKCFTLLFLLVSTWSLFWINEYGGIWIFVFSTRPAECSNTIHQRARALSVFWNILSCLLNVYLMDSHLFPLSSCARLGRKFSVHTLFKASVFLAFSLLTWNKNLKTNVFYLQNPDVSLIMKHLG